MAIRGLGFDIKKFDFNRDAQELNATDSDSEEVEINTKIDRFIVAFSTRNCCFILAIKQINHNRLISFQKIIPFNYTFKTF